MIDTYDIERAAQLISQIGPDIKAVRIDSGNLVEQSKKVRKILDDNGNNDVLIVVSSDLNEYKIKEILDHNSPIDAFGVGTELATSKDDPTLSGIYKLIEYNNIPKFKLSKEKITIPGQKQIYRTYKNNLFYNDKIFLTEENPPEDSESLLISIFNKGELIYKSPNLQEIRENYFTNMEKLPLKYKSLNKINSQDIEYSKKIQLLMSNLVKKE